MEGYAQVAVRKELFIAPFAERFKTTFNKTSNKMPKHCIFAKFLFLEG